MEPHTIYSLHPIFYKLKLYKEKYNLWKSDKKEYMFNNFGYNFIFLNLKYSLSVIY